ncbi:hypothetical protein [Bacteroides thetaiotaomicron]|uniref:hypothetical protein n=1 Tax=Bacteroides thetaiotaomicron TaxID=818 RepID=UPI00374423FE
MHNTKIIVWGQSSDYALAPIERRLIAIILIVLTSWIGLLFYYFYGKARMPQWLGTGVQKY